MFVPLLLALSCSATNVESRATVSSSVRAGQIASLTDQSENGAEAVVEPALLFEFGERSRSTRLRLFGRFSTLQLESRQQNFARGGLSFSHRFSLDRANELFYALNGEGGTLDFRQATVLLGSDGDTDPEVPVDGSTATQIDSFLVRFFSADASLGLRTRLSATHTLTTSVQVVASEGDGEEGASNQFPRERTITVNGALERELSRRDTLRANLTASLSDFEAVGLYQVATLIGGWRRRFRDGAVGGELGALVAQTDATNNVTVVPSASMNAERDVWSRGEDRVRTRFDAGVRTAFDRFSGRLLPRSQIGLSVQADFGAEWRATARGSFQNPIGDGIGGVVGGLELNSTGLARGELSWAMTRELYLTTGVTWGIRATPLDEPWRIIQQELVGTVGLSADYLL